MRPFEMAGVAMHISPRGFLPITLSSGPAWITKVSPSSLRQKIFPSEAQGDAVKPLVSLSMRRFVYPTPGEAGAFSARVEMPPCLP